VGRTCVKYLVKFQTKLLGASMGTIRLETHQFISNIPAVSEIVF
jgi:hypothetical protein